MKKLDNLLLYKKVISTLRHECNELYGSGNKFNAGDTETSYMVVRNALLNHMPIDLVKIVECYTDLKNNWIDNDVSVKQPRIKNGFRNEYPDIESTVRQNLVRESYIRILKYTLFTNGIEIIINNENINKKFSNSRKKRNHDISGLIVDSNNYKWIYVDNYWCSFNSTFIELSNTFRRLFGKTYIQKCVSDTNCNIVFYGPCTIIVEGVSKYSRKSKIEYLLFGGLHKLEKICNNWLSNYVNLKLISLYESDVLAVGRNFFNNMNGFLTLELNTDYKIRLEKHGYKFNHIEFNGINDILVNNTFSCYWLEMNNVKSIKFLNITDLHYICRFLKECRKIEYFEIINDTNNLENACNETIGELYCVIEKYSLLKRIVLPELLSNILKERYRTHQSIKLVSDKMN